MAGSDRAPLRATVLKEATQWHVRMHEPTSQKEVQAFEAWLRADPQHAQAYHGIDRVAALGDRLPRRLLDSAPSRPWVRQLQPAFGVIVAVALLGGAGAWLLGEATPAARAAITNPGPAVRAVRLRGGVTAVLDAGARLLVATNWSDREAWLESGRMRLAISAADVMTVHAGSVDIQASSAKFDIRLVGPTTTIAVIAGSIDVRRNSARQDTTTTRLLAGDTAVADRGQVVGSSTPPSDVRWPDARLDFADITLASVVATANRRSKPPINIADETIGALKVTGVLDVRDTRALARKLAAALDLTASETSTGILLHR